MVKKLIFNYLCFICLIIILFLNPYGKYNILITICLYLQYFFIVKTNKLLVVYYLNLIRYIKNKNKIEYYKNKKENKNNLEELNERPARYII